METREPNAQEKARWNRFKNYFEKITAPRIKALNLLAQIAESAEDKIEELTGNRPDILTAGQTETIKELGRRGAIIDRLITKVLLQKYGVQFDPDGNLTIVGAQADEGDIYPRNSATLSGWLLVVGVVAVVLLLAGDQNNERLAKDTENEAVKLQRTLTEQDIKMLNAPKEIRDRWVDWKDETAKAARAALRKSPSKPSWFNKIFGDKGTSMLIAGAVGIAAIYFLVPMMRRN